MEKEKHLLRVSVIRSTGGLFSFTVGGTVGGLGPEMINVEGQPVVLVDSRARSLAQKARQLRNRLEGTQVVQILTDEIEPQIVQEHEGAVIFRSR